jgi:hydroxymethylpyrimidine pyrophosphatase-like HAD family hydrolase
LHDTTIKGITKGIDIYYDILIDKHPKLEELNSQEIVKPIKLEIFTGDISKKNYLLAELNKEENLKAFSSHISNIEIVNSRASKGLAVKKYLENLNSIYEMSIGIGDEENDLPLFESVDYKIAMGNSNPKLLEKADYITKTYENSGVSYFLNKFLVVGDRL